MINNKEEPVYTASEDLEERVRILSLKIKPSGIVILYVLTHTGTDGACCPTLKTIIKYKLNNNKLDKIWQIPLNTKSNMINPLYD